MHTVRSLIQKQSDVVIGDLADFLESVETDSSQRARIRDNNNCQFVSNDIIKSMEPDLQEIDEMIRNNFTIPSNVILNEDFKKSLADEKDEETLLDTVHRLEMTLKQVRIWN